MSRIQNTPTLPTKTPTGSAQGNAPFIGSHGRIGTPSTHPALQRHDNNVVITPLTQPQPQTRDTGTNPRSR
jgi:hypothetical protein